MTKQVVTIQVGNQANYVASHFWNLQKLDLSTPVSHRELDPSALFHEASHATSADRRFTPRAQIIDATGAFGAISTQHGHPIAPLSVHDATTAASESWPEKQHVALQERIPVSSPSSSVTGSHLHYWANFLSVRLHPRSCQPLSGVHHDVTEMLHFATGLDWASASRLDGLYDDLRYFVEGCDSFGGLLIATDADNAFAGLTSAYLRTLSDELGPTPTLVMAAHRRDRLCVKPIASALRQPFEYGFEKRLSRNEAGLVHACIDHDVQYVPFSTVASRRLPVRAFDPLDAFRASAVLGVVMDAALSPLRQSASISGLVAAVRPRSAAFYSSLYSNIPCVRQPLATDAADSLLNAVGTVNLSDMWTCRVSTPNATVKSDKHADHVLPQRHFLCSRGFSPPLDLALNTEQGIMLPTNFPRVLEDDEPIDGEESFVEERQVQVVSGLVCDQDCAVAALQELGASLDGRISSSKIDVMDKVEASEMQESLRSHAEDINDM